MQDASTGKQRGRLRTIWRSGGFLGEVKLIAQESSPKASGTFLFACWKAAAWFRRCSFKGFVLLLKLFLVTRKAGESLIGARGARTARASLGEGLGNSFCL